MDMTTGLQQTLKTEQTLSPQMLQSLALLPMPITELKEFLQREIESNPALEIPEREFDAPPASGQQDRGPDNRMPDDVMDDFDGSDYGFMYPSDPEASDRKQQMLENTAKAGESLSEHLLIQLGESNLDGREREIGEMLIGNLDANGFFIVPLDTLFEGRDFSPDEIDKVLATVQGFDPPGICVADFKESLILQAKLSGMQDSDLGIFRELVNNRLEQLKTGKTREISLALGIPAQDVESFYSIIRSLTPFPGRNYDSNSESFVVPEFSVRRHNGVPVLTMNRANIPDLEISPEFSSLAQGLAGSNAKEAGSYIRENIRKAKTLISQVNLRYSTLHKAALALVDMQADFFLNGPRFLKPLTLAQVAGMIGVHETTMSRLAQNKYVDTDWGIFPMKYFFSSGVQDVSRNAVKDMISGILKEEPGLSDQKISDRLARMGVKCARRTVGKYRTELNIESSFERSGSPIQ